VDVSHQQRVTTEFTEFDVGYSEHVIDTVEFHGDTVDFCFWAPFSVQPLRCFVQLTDAETQQTLLNGQADVMIEGDNDDRNYLSFSGFGFLDDQMTERVKHCQYEVWCEGVARARVTVFV
jgi:hypothetical protein